MRSLLHRLREHVEPVGLTPADALALLILLAGSVSLTAVVWWSTSSPGSAVGTPSEAGEEVLQVTSTPSTAEATPTPPTEPVALVVHVAGEVHQPGVITLPAGARVGEAIQAAGGPTSQAVLDALNLARPLVDGEQVRVPAPGEEGDVGPPVAAPTQPEQDAPLDLNTATAAQLEALPGIGPVTAQRIVDHRDAIGGFVAVTQLLEVPGIGPARFADLEARVRL